MTFTETFKFGSAPGQYAPGTFIQDSHFKNAELVSFMWNKQNYDEGDASISDSRLNLGGSNAFADGDTLIATVKK